MAELNPQDREARPSHGELFIGKSSFTSNPPCDRLVGSAWGNSALVKTLVKYIKSEEIIGKETQEGWIEISSTGLMGLIGLTGLVCPGASLGEECAMIGVHLSLLFPGNEASMAGKMSDVYFKRRYTQTNSLPYVTGFTPKETDPIKCLPGTRHHVRLRGIHGPFYKELQIQLAEQM